MTSKEVSDDIIIKTDQTVLGYILCNGLNYTDSQEYELIDECKYYLYFDLPYYIRNECNLPGDFDFLWSSVGTHSPTHSGMKVAIKERNINPDLLGALDGVRKRMGHAHNRSSIKKLETKVNHLESRIACLRTVHSEFSATEFPSYEKEILTKIHFRIEDLEKKRSAYSKEIEDRKRMIGQT